MKVRKIRSKPVKLNMSKVKQPPPGGDMAEAFDRHMDTMKGMGTTFTMRKDRDYDQHVPSSNKKMLGMKKIK